ncbi:GumC family protein [Spirosoma endbachense]|uniref:non-specific protein-tyrosine kinase n=1 Tax=Spirosoma endbachense TaxID=2666025 RepID=A0A6P1VS89_9BACT|nr:polysaccharide biosynthesis tyrosine autokinase [Spirosoma endbachense]QHV95288.1 polysaccharide biosynthesis tyrosine autokinase [Spirosoma endbachense]
MNNSEQAFAEEQEEDTNILGYVFKYLRYWYLIVLALAISFTYAYVYLKRFTPIYQVSATLLIKDEKKMNTEVLEKLDMKGTSKLVENEIEVLKSRALIGKVVDNLNLIVSYWTEGKARDLELYTNSPIRLNATEITDYAYNNPLYIQVGPGKKYQLFDQEQNSLGTFEYSQLVKSQYGKFRVFDKDSLSDSYPVPVRITFQNRDILINTLTSQLQIALLNYESSLISLGFETSLPKKGKDILTKLLDEYAFATLEDKNREATNTLRFIEERLKLVTAELGDVEENVEQYRRKKGITDLSSEANLFLGKVEDNDAKLNELAIQIKVLEGVEQYLNSTQVGIVAPATMMGITDPILTSYIEQLSQLEIERSKLAQTVQPGNPYLETINNQMRNVKQAIRENLANQKQSLSVTKRSLTDLNTRLEGAISTIPRKEREFVGIKRQANIKEDLYLLLLKTREETAISYASTVTDSRIVDAPFSTGEAVKPNKSNIYLMALLLGLAIPIALITLKETFTNTVRSKREIERKTGMRVFSEISLKAKDDKGEIIDTKSHSFMSEQIRMLRSNMQYLFLDAQEEIGKTVLITSSTSGEGKSFIALNLAASLALLDKKVVILGLDLRKPKIQGYLKISNKTGISSYLIGRLGIADIIQSTDIDNLFVIPSGPTPPNPSELIANGRVKLMIEGLRHSFDYIIIDTPPVGLVTDATLLATLADVCFYVVRYKTTAKLHLKTISDLDKKKIFKSINIIFNAVKLESSPDHAYGYGYGKVDYYDEERKKNWISRLLTK